MASDLQNILQRVSNKSDVLIEKYMALVAEKESVESKNVALTEENATLLKELQHLREENNYLRLARTMAISTEQMEQNKAKISKLVRDIDKCISQLTD
ncbi:MAG: hypothetical protein ACI4AH_03110 [Muribaculaceae bacterium]